MAVEKVICAWTGEAAADLSAKQYTLVKYDANDNLVPAGAGDNAFALQDKPRQGESGTIGLVGVSKVVYGGTVAAGDYLSSDANGHAVKATNTVASGTAANGTHIVGQALVSGVSGDVGSMLIGNGLA